jgi:hypothetical protein
MSPVNQCFCKINKLYIKKKKKGGGMLYGIGIRLYEISIRRQELQMS